MESIFTRYTNRGNFGFVKRCMRYLTPSAIVAAAFDLSTNTVGCNVCGNIDHDKCIFECENHENYFKKIKGCLVICDENRDKFTIYNEELARKEISPYETFDVISLYLGSKCGVIKNWEIVNKDGKITRPSDYLVDSLNFSYTWVFRDIIDMIGRSKMEEELKKLDFGNCDVSNWDGNCTGNLGSYHINGFWLDSCLKISAINWVNVLKKLSREENFRYIFEKFLYLKNIDGYSIYGRACRNVDSGWKYERERIKEKWFLGIAIKGNKKIYFAANVDINEIFSRTYMSPCFFVENLVYKILKYELLD